VLYDGDVCLGGGIIESVDIAAERLPPTVAAQLQAV
jgi:hypothetical protein